MSPSTSDCRCLKQTSPSPVQVIIERTRDSMTDMFTKYRQKVGEGARQAVELATRDSMTDIFTKYRQKVGEGARQAVELARKRSQEFLHRPFSKSTSTSGKRGIIKPNQKKSFWSRLNFDEVATFILVLLILLMLFLGLCLVRSYNHAYAYGSGGCLWPVFWGQCQIIT